MINNLIGKSFRSTFSMRSRKQCGVISALKSSSTYTALVLWYALVPSNLRPQVITSFAYSTLASTSTLTHYVPRLCPPGSSKTQHGFGIKPHKRSNKSLTQRQMSSQNEATELSFHRGDKIQVEVVKFGPLGASVEVIGHNSHNEKDLIPEGEQPLGYGLILQKEIKYFRGKFTFVKFILYVLSRLVLDVYHLIRTVLTL